MGRCREIHRRIHVRWEPYVLDPNGIRVAQPGTAPIGFDYSLRDFQRLAPGRPVTAYLGFSRPILNSRGAIFEPLGNRLELIGHGRV